MKKIIPVALALTAITSQQALARKTVINEVKIPVEHSTDANPVNSYIDEGCKNTSDQSQIFGDEWPLFTLEASASSVFMKDGAVGDSSVVAIPLSFKTSKMVALSDTRARSCRGLALTGYLYRDPFHPNHWSTRYSLYVRTNQGTQQIKTGKLDLDNMTMDINRDTVRQSFNIATQDIDTYSGQRQVYQIDLAMHPSQQYVSWLTWKQGQNRVHNKNTGKGIGNFPLEDPNATLDDVMKGGKSNSYVDSGFHDPIRPNIGGFGSIVR